VHKGTFFKISVNRNAVHREELCIWKWLCIFISDNVNEPILL
jgi:hypothetical protein